MSSSNRAAIVLAAGASSRMSSPKALLDVNGVPAVERIVATLAEAGIGQVVVVVGRHAGQIRAGADLTGSKVVDHPGWAAGRTSSIQTGLAALDPTPESVVLALVDMPHVRAGTVRELLAAFHDTAVPADVAVPSFDGRRGHPVVLRRGLVPRILALGPDDPLRDLLRGCTRVEVPVDDPAVLQDLNTPGDVASWNSDTIPR